MKVIIEMEMVVETVMEMKEEMEIEMVTTTMGMETMVIMWEELCKLPMVPKEEDKIERFIWGLPDSIHANVTSFTPIRFQDAIRMASRLMDQKVHANVVRQFDNKRTWENQSRDNHDHYHSDCTKPKNQNRGNQAGNKEDRGRAYTLRGGEKAN
ncbi:hypothetical protein Tco_1011463 [Tanacetum coccineum]